MGSVSYSYQNSPSHLKHVVPLDFNSVKTVPDSHEWVVEPHASGSLPLINLSDPNAKSLIRQACEKLGAFQVINHGVPMNLLKQVELETFRLFNLPTHRKLCALRSPDGIVGYGVPRIQCYFSKLLWSEGFSMMKAPVEHAAQLWPHQPDQQTTFCNIMEEGQKEMKASTERMMKLIVESLELGPEDVKWLKGETEALFALNSYPICPEPNKAMGLGPHTDTSLLTVVYQSSCSGLQFLGDGIGWIPVHPIPGTLVVNVGDLLSILTNGRFKSVLHRAVVNDTHHRVSVAYIYGPPSDVKISPLTKLTDDDHPPLYRPVVWKDYAYAKSKHHNNTLNFFKNTKEEDP
ncbi:hypothetical protein VNO77_24370 [Canavalia gladiata]|uniref:Fe2OG dioxygenase domain-containing protein n=1 Tax=Canavalia gladiata TaxID=3824 RepID=A0AAN9QG63_CANGL